MVANPFGKRALAPGSDGTLKVKKGDALTLRFGLYLFNASEKLPDMAVAYREFTDAATSTR
jgi:hypothetical protein